MSLSDQFRQRYVEIQIANRRTRIHQAGVDIGLWRGFVAACESGYNDSLDEYFYDLQVRTTLETALKDKALTEIDGYEVFREKVIAIDNDFRRIANITLPVKEPAGMDWWHLIVPDRGRHEFAANLQQEFGVIIRIVPESDA